MQKLNVINGLRGFAILAVIYHHIFAEFTAPGFMSIKFANMTFLPMTYLANGWLGVNLFFILSGFVLSYPYFLQKRKFNSINNIKIFYLHRIKRLLPLYYFSIIFSMIFVVHPISINLFIKEVFLLTTVLFNFTNDMWFPRYNWVLWSLGIEIWFSIIFPFLIIAIKKYGMLNILFIVLIVSLLTRIIGNSAIYDIGNPFLNPVKDSLLGRLDEFLWGIFVCYIYVNKIELISKLNVKIALLISIIMISISCLLWDYINLNLLTRSIIPFINIISDIGFVMLILSLLRIKNGVIKYIFTNYLLQLFGVMCYSLYIWHGIIGIVILNILVEYNFQNFIIYCCIVFIFSSFSYRFIEFRHEPNIKKLFLLDNIKN
jgi:peptidoglycan/LPS O-acetylase OafA/YrhL